MCQSIHTNLIVATVNSHGLFTHRTLIGISGRLIMIGERNNRCANAEDHRRMDLTVRVIILLLLSVLVDIFSEHGNHSRLFLLDIKELHESVDEQLFEVPFLLTIFIVQNLLNVLFPRQKLIVLNNKHRSLDTTSIRVDLDLSLINISNDGIFLRNLVSSSHATNISQERVWIVVVADPLPVQEDLVRLGVLIIVVWAKWFNAIIVQDLNMIRWPLPYRNLGHERKILDEST